MMTKYKTRQGEILYLTHEEFCEYPRNSRLTLIEEEATKEENEKPKERRQLKKPAAKTN